MKNIFLSFLICSVLGFTACDDFLDTKPSVGLPSEEAIADMNSAQNALNGCYNILQNTTYYNHNFLAYGDIRGDDVQSNRGQQGSYAMYIFNHTFLNSAGAQLGYMWFRPLQLISNASRLIESIDGGKVIDGTETEKNNMIGHAIALRAMAHFDMVKVFGYPFKKDNGASWGAIIIDHTLANDELPVRSTVNETFEFIVKELERAIPMMSTAKDEYNRMNAYAARALLARAYLYWEKNDKAYQVASSLIEELKSGSPYQLYTNEGYMDAFAYSSEGTNFDPESLLEIFNTSSDNPARNGLGNMYHPNGYADIMLTEVFQHFMEADKGDVRYNMVGYMSDKRPYLTKYPGIGDQAAYDNNYPLIRLSEVYLIAAEAAVKGGGDQAAGLAYLNEIVKRGNPANSVSQSEFTLNRVLDERRKEFVGEGHRYFDLLRNGYTWSRKGGYHFTAVESFDVSWDYYRCILPVPLDQFKRNPDLQQNPEYQRE